MYMYNITHFVVSLVSGLSLSSIYYCKKSEGELGRLQFAKCSSLPGNPRLYSPTVKHQ